MLRHALSLSLVLFSLALARGVNGDFGVKDYQRVAWKWSDEKASLDYCVKKFNATRKGETVRGEAYQFEAERQTIFTIGGDRSVSSSSHLKWLRTSSNSSRPKNRQGYLGCSVEGYRTSGSPHEHRNGWQGRHGLGQRGEGPLRQNP